MPRGGLCASRRSGFGTAGEQFNMKGALNAAQRARKEARKKGTVWDLGGVPIWIHRLSPQEEADKVQA